MFDAILFTVEINITKMGVDNVVGGAINLNCTVNVQEFEEFFVISWIHDEPAVHQSVKNSSNVLQLSPLMASHAGIYVCNASLDSVTGKERTNITMNCKSHTFYIIVFTTISVTLPVDMNLTLFMNTGDPVMAGDSVSIICSVRIDKHLVDVGVDVDLQLVSPQGVNATERSNDADSGHYQTSISFHSVSVQVSGIFTCNATVKSSPVNHFLIPAQNNRTLDLVLSKSGICLMLILSSTHFILLSFSSF